MTLKSITPEFLRYLLDQANRNEDNAAHGGRQDDGGAGHTRELVCAYQSGRDNKIPAFWLTSLETFHQRNNEEYQNYLRLKAKFEGSSK